MYFSGVLSGPFLARFAESIDDCDELACDGFDDDLVWLTSVTQAISESQQERVVMAGYEGGYEMAKVVVKQGRPPQKADEYELFLHRA